MDSKVGIFTRAGLNRSLFTHRLMMFSIKSAINGDSKNGLAEISLLAVMFNRILGTDASSRHVLKGFRSFIYSSVGTFGKKRRFCRKTFETDSKSLGICQDVAFGAIT